MKARLIFTILSVAAVLFLGKGVSAQPAPLVDYQGQPVVDSDLDGLSDEGEKNIYGTDVQNFDTDGDRYGDGVEVLSGMDPLNPNSYPELPAGIIAQTQIKSIEIPWPWYVSRVSALIGFLLLYVSIFLGLAIRTPLLNKILKPIYSLKVHCWISLQALIFVFIHGISLLFDKFINFSWRDVLVPFYSGFEPVLVGLGVSSFYFMLILVATSYFRKHLSYGIWRFFHFLNIILYAFVIYHSLNLGTDLKNGVLRNIFIGANILLIGLFFVNIIFKIFTFLKGKFKRKIINENIPQSPSKVV